MWSWAACFTVLCWGRRWMAWCSYREWHLVNYFWASHVGHFVFWCTWCFPQQISGILFSNFSFSPWTLTYACIFICTCMHLPPLSFYCLSTSIGFIFTILSKIGEMEVIKRKIWNWINWIRLGVLNSVLLSPQSANYLREILFIFSFFFTRNFINNRRNYKEVGPAVYKMTYPRKKTKLQRNSSNSSFLIFLNTKKNGIFFWIH